MDITQIATVGMTIVGAGLLSWGITTVTNKVRLNGIEKNVIDLDKQINGNGQEGLIVKVIRVETNIKNIANDIKEIKELLK